MLELINEFENEVNSLKENGSFQVENKNYKMALWQLETVFNNEHSVLSTDENWVMVDTIVEQTYTIPIVDIQDEEEILNGNSVVMTYVYLEEFLSDLGSQYGVAGVDITISSISDNNMVFKAAIAYGTIYPMSDNYIVINTPPTPFPPYVEMKAGEPGFCGPPYISYEGLHKEIQKKLKYKPNYCVPTNKILVLDNLLHYFIVPTSYPLCNNIGYTWQQMGKIWTGTNPSSCVPNSLCNQYLMGGYQILCDVVCDINKNNDPWVCYNLLVHCGGYNSYYFHHFTFFTAKCHFLNPSAN